MSSEDNIVHNSTVDANSANSTNSTNSISNSSNKVLVIKDLVVAVKQDTARYNVAATAAAPKIILNGLNLTINKGEVHAIMGPNGAGKSTLANVLARNNNYEILSGSIEFLGHNILELAVEECARLGMFLSFQYPVAIPGISNVHFLKTAVNSVRKSQQKPAIDTVDFLKIVKAKMAELNMKEELLYRSINDDFSGGEKKRNEILQLSLLEPTLAILDETDSGLDIDALKDVAAGINSLCTQDRAILLITHYQRVLDYITPDYVHVLANGKIAYTGDKTLPQRLEQEGYAGIL